MATPTTIRKRNMKVSPTARPTLLDFLLLPPPCGVMELVGEGGMEVGGVMVGVDEVVGGGMVLGVMEGVGVAVMDIVNGSRDVIVNGSRDVIVKGSKDVIVNGSRDVMVGTIELLMVVVMSGEAMLVVGAMLVVMLGAMLVVEAMLVVMLGAMLVVEAMLVVMLGAMLVVLPLMVGEVVGTPLGVGMLRKEVELAALARNAQASKTVALTISIAEPARRGRAE